MILYTMMPLDLVFPPEAEFEKQFSMHYKGIPIEVIMDSPSSCRIARILSTDPSHYLNANVQPGTSFSLWQENIL
ncbi:ribonuclease [Bacillus sp. M6-12]|uniref:YlzJ-like family protein n=1 Tax=Bacillus sp. M6-12 TaxID=2054166 RepID=UPI000C758C8F|nr:YlzJ-like family protein [Bacillus sp. M6-12]PLS16733.1 ribonuclease [Bacillus sp. M6-12]